LARISARSGGDRGSPPAISASKAETLREGVALAAQSIDSGKAMGVLEALVKLSRDKV